MSIKRSKDGAIMISPDHVFEWECGKTGDAMSVRADEFATAEAFEYAPTYGLKQSTSDAYAGCDGAAEARKARDEKKAKILAGTVGTGGGGKKADVVTQEALAIALMEMGCSAAAFKKAFGSGKVGVVKYAQHAAAALIEASDAEPGSFDQDAVTAEILQELYQDAADAIDNRVKRASKIRAKISPPKGDAADAS